MRLKQSVQEGIEVFALEGEIDFHFAPVLRQMLQSKVRAQCPSLVLDFARVDFIDSRGIAAILEYLRDCAESGGKIALAALNRNVKPIIDTVRLDKVMPIFATVPEAVVAMKGKLQTQPSG